MTTFRIVTGDCLEAMAEMEENSVDAIVTDPPYGIRFMGKAWDGADIEDRARYERERQNLRSEKPLSKMPGREGETLGVPIGSPAAQAGKYDLTQTGTRAFQAWTGAWATEALRVLKPGGHLLSFGGTRTYHRLTCALEDAGFEIRDCLAWLYGSGFPKSLDVSKAIDKAAGAEREVVGRAADFARDGAKRSGEKHGDTRQVTGFAGDTEHGWDRDITVPATPEAQRWQGWGTALKPAFEPIVLARKPLSERSVAANVQRWGTGALNVDGCRVGTEPAYIDRPRGPRSPLIAQLDGEGTSSSGGPGRWPANVVLDEEAAGMLDEQTGEVGGGGGGGGGSWFGGNYPNHAGFADAGGASRFFYVVPNRENEGSWSSGARSAEPSSTPSSEAAGSVPSPVATGAFPATSGANPSKAPSMSGTPSGSRPTAGSGTPPTPSTEGRSSPEPRPGSIDPADPASGAEPRTPTATTTTTPSPSKSATSAGLATSNTTPTKDRGEDQGATRFRYVPKADREERNRGLEGFEERLTDSSVRRVDQGVARSHGTRLDPTRNTHPTVKPVELMQWLVRMVTPPGGAVLDPFMGSGTTGMAAMREGKDFVGIEREPEYVEIARARILGDGPLFNVEVMP